MAPLLEVRGLRRRFGGTVAVSDVSFALAPGEVLGLVGPNGSGKTTLLQCVAGLTWADAGEVVAGGRGLGVRERGRVLFSLADGIAPWPEQAAGWVLDFVARQFAPTSAMPDRAAVVAGLDLAPFLGQRLGTLSKGQRKRVLLALALSTPQPVLLLDEPFDGLDFRQVRAAIALLRDAAARGRAILVSIHQLDIAERACDRLLLLQDGAIVGGGAPAELRARAGGAGASLEDVFLAMTPAPR